ncbi:MAG: hypothetical protein AB1422_15250 [bacterium]
MLLKIISKIIGLIILVTITVIVFIVTYNIVYNKTAEKQKVLKQEKELREKKTKTWIAETTRTEGNQLNELLKLYKDYKLDETTLKIIVELSTRFNVTPDVVLEALSLIDLNKPKATKQKIARTIKKQKDKLYWLETKDASQNAPWIKQRKEIITMCQIELGLLNKAEKDIEVKEKLEAVRTQYLHNKLYPRLYQWKKEAKEGGGH